MRNEAGLTKQQILSTLTKSPHGKLTEYVPVASIAAKQDPEFFAHLIAWNAVKGEVRDARVALPVFALRGDQELVENALAHLAMLDPRNLVRAIDFAWDQGGPSNVLDRLVARYLRDREAMQSVWDRTALQHRRSMRTLYARHHVKPDSRADAILFKGQAPRGTVFDVVRSLPLLSPQEAAGAILDRKIPFLIAQGALGAKAKSPEIVLALIDRMSPTELVTNTKMLERLGVKTDPALRGAYQAALEKAAVPKKTTRGKTTLKATRAAEVLAEDDPVLSTKLRALQEAQLNNLKGIEGNWLVLGDKSGSMAVAIETARQVAGILTRVVKGKVYLVFFDATPLSIDVTGADYEMIKKATARVGAGGQTSIGCGLQRMLDEQIEIDGIAVVSDGGENTAPAFSDAYARYQKRFDKAPPVYFYRTSGDPNVLSINCRRSGIDVQEFDLTGGVDLYSLPNLVQTMRANRYSLIDEVSGMPLVRLNDVLTRTTTVEVLTHARHAEATGSRSVATR